MPIYTVQPDRVAAAVFGSLRRRVVGALLVLLACVAVVTVGFYAIDVSQHGAGGSSRDLFDALWNTLNLVSTVGSLENVSVAERAWGMLAIIVGLGAVLYGFGSLQALFHGDVARLIERRKMQRKISDMKHHIVVCGYGRVGQAAAAELRKHGAQPLVIDIDPQAVARADEEGFTVLEGDCAQEQTLREAGLDRAGGLIAALNKDSANTFVILIAREIAPSLRIIARAERTESRRTLRRAGADRSIAPGELAAQQLSHLMLKPIVSEFIAAATGEGEYDFAEMAVADYPHLQGRTLGELDLPHRAEAIVISVVSGGGEQEFNPSGDRALAEDDTLLLVCREGGLERIAALGTP